MTARWHVPLFDEPVSLDLVNTRVGHGGADVDLLETPSALPAWLAAESGRLSWSGAVTGADVRAVRRWRDAIAALLSARRARARQPRDAVKVVNAALSTSVPVIRLAGTSNGPRAERRGAESRRDALLHALAMEAVAILAGPDAALVRTCEHPDCVLQFFVRNPRRRWCLASVCGNRARVACHYTRHRTSA